MNETAGIATYIPVAVAVIAAISVVLAPVISSRPDGLARAERMTALIAKMDPGAERDVLIEARNAVSARWALRTAAPSLAFRLIPSVALLIPGVLLGISAAGGGSVDLSNWVPWVSLVCSGLAGLLAGTVVGSRQAWVNARLEARGIPVDIPRRNVVHRRHDAASTRGANNAGPSPT